MLDTLAYISLMFLMIGAIVCMTNKKTTIFTCLSIIAVVILCYFTYLEGFNDGQLDEAQNKHLIINQTAPTNSVAINYTFDATNNLKTYTINFNHGN